MKKMTKRVAGLALSAALALTIGVGVYNVYKEDAMVTASAAEATVDLSSTVSAENGWGKVNGYAALGHYRFWTDEAKSISWTNTTLTKGDTYSTLLDAIKVNGQTINQWTAAYKAGETGPITWAEYPNFGGGTGMIDRIGALVVNNDKYAPIDVTLCNHGTKADGTKIGCSVDIYVPYSMIDEVESIEFTKDFKWVDGETTYTFGEGVTFSVNSFKAPYKQVGEVSELNVIETKVTGIDGTYEKSDKFLSFYLSENNYTGTSVKFTDKTYLRGLNFYDYILMDGKKIGSLCKNEGGSYIDLNEPHFNVWGRMDTFSTRWPTAVVGDSVKEIKILAGCQFPAYNDENTVYEVTEDTTFIRQADGSFLNPNDLMDAEDINIGWATVAGTNKELYKVDIATQGWTFDLGENKDAYHWNYYAPELVKVRQNIYVNDKSVYEINTTVDDSAYVYATPPSSTVTLQQTNPVDGQMYDVFVNPVVVEARENMIILYIHKDYVDSLCKNFGDMLTVTVKKGICENACVNGQILTEDVSATVYGIGYDLNLIDGNPRLGGEVQTLSVLAGMPLNNLPVLTAEHKNFLGWVDAEGNPAPAVMPDESFALYAKWEVIPYTLTIVYPDETTKEFTFGVEYDFENGIELKASDLAFVLEDNLLEETEETAYGYAEKIPTEFKVEDQIFTMIKMKNIFTITFTDAEGNDIGVKPITFTAKTIDDLVLPAVPEKEGYTGAWNKTTDRLSLEDVTLYAVYTEVKEESPAPSKPNDSTDTDSEADVNDSASDTSSTDNGAGLLAGCSGVVGGVAGTMAALGIAVVAMMKKKED